MPLLAVQTSFNRQLWHNWHLQLFSLNCELQLSIATYNISLRSMTVNCDITFNWDLKQSNATYNCQLHLCLQNATFYSRLITVDCDLLLQIAIYNWKLRNILVIGNFDLLLSIATNSIQVWLLNSQLSFYLESTT